MSARPRMTLLAVVATLLATIPLGALFADASWFPPALVAVLLVAGAGMISRRFRLPPPAQVLLAAVLVTDWITVRFASAHAHLGVVPSRQTFDDLGGLLQSAGHDIDQLAAPVPTHEGLVLLVTLAVAGLALVVDLAAVTARKPALTGLPFLAAFAVAGGLAPDSTGPVTFLCVSAGWLALLMFDQRDRLARWGRTLGTADAAATGTVTSSGRRIGAAALGIAVLVPLVLPGLGHMRFGSGNGTGPGGRSSSVTTFNPLVNIREELNRGNPQPLIITRTDDTVPDYLRMTTLDRFDGAVWSSSQLKQGVEARVSNGIPVPAEVAATPSIEVHTDVRVLGLQVHWLPVPSIPTKVDAAGDWRFDERSGTVFSARNDSHQLRYTVVSSRLDPTVESLRNAGPPGPALQDYLKLPKSLPAKVRQLAQQVTARAGNDYDRAVALQDWLRSPPFVYDTTAPPGDGGDAILSFLASKRGFCEQYAATMAAMARALGIPARVAVGFTPGRLDASGNRRVITTDDAHAWPELYFAGTGWLRFEPTPRSDGQATVPGYTLPAADNGGGNTPDSVPTAAPSGAPLPGQDPNVDPLTLPGGGTGGGAGSGRSVPWTLVAALAALALAAAAPGVARAEARRRRWSAGPDPTVRAHAAWAELRDDAADYGRPWSTSDSPRGTARRLARDLPLSAEAGAALGRVVAAEERARYAPDGAGGSAVSALLEGLPADVRTVRRELRAGASRRRRLLAVALPASMVLRAGGAIGDAVDAALTRVDRIGAAAGRWLGARVHGRRRAARS